MISAVKRLASIKILASKVKRRLAEAKLYLTTKRIVTIDFGSSAIRIMESRGRRVMKWASVSLEPNTLPELYNSLMGG